MRLSADELEQGQLSLDTLSIALNLIRVNGYVIFEKVLPEDFIEALHTAHERVYAQYLQNPDPNVDKHHRITLPFCPPYCDERVIANTLVVPLLNSLLGNDFVCHALASETCSSGSVYQPAHSDAYQLFPGSDIKPPPYHIVLNIPLVDVTEENGAIEYWAGGTHLNTFGMEEIEALAPHMPSERAIMPAGSLFIRDGRMWHRGTANKSNAPRPNLAVVYTRPWVDIGPRRIDISQSVYDSLSVRARTIFREENIGGDDDSTALLK